MREEAWMRGAVPLVRSSLSGEGRRPSCAAVPAGTPLAVRVEQAVRMFGGVRSGYSLPINKPGGPRGGS